MTSFIFLRFDYNIRLGKSEMFYMNNNISIKIYPNFKQTVFG